MIWNFFKQTSQLNPRDKVKVAFFFWLEGGGGRNCDIIDIINKVKLFSFIGESKSKPGEQCGPCTYCYINDLQNSYCKY